MFSTHLYNQLRALSGPARKIQKEIRFTRGSNCIRLDVENTNKYPHHERIPAPEGLAYVEPPEVNDLSDDSRILLTKALAGELARKNGKVGCKTTAQALLSAEGWTPRRLNKAWEELRSWVLEGGTPW